ncbi:Rpn family recombination-promoting nuclease/putative transposase [Wolbachia endosymbiont of Brugia malayi]|uniref:Rpn family recombination-promoting nuclease/putative transposase n=1 Tax=Wolbachia endosymbiont of Brugia malayi TaxID=80849 RepID=UPI00004C9383|nr:Rpn family recombination-promoting nuclease/putative transposase [Wolbachia endosymbiont of Brugia malayi]AAW70962.1 Uncharacterized conserved protein [Wolbachia endosymbiont strain TRS of Brugia malayi]QCB61916.1 Rpn family recombination-promoting nuclease/putative transposase [Wolbachia endosymbiont of Brugia malayi]
MALSKFLDLKFDLIFKKIFGTEKNKKIIICFLNNILGFAEINAIQEVEFLSAIIDPEIASNKQSIIVDVFCKDATGTRRVIEVQLAINKGFEKRVQPYAVKAYSRQLDKSGNYIVDLKKVFFIAISNCNLLSEKVDYISTHNIHDTKTNGHYLKDFQFIFIELPKFSKSKVEQLINIVEHWCFFFKNAEDTTETDLKRVAKKVLIIKLAYDGLDEFHWNEEDIIAYEERVMNLQKEKAILEYRLDLATEKGREEGVKISKERGIKVGAEKGREEGVKKAKIAVAKNSLKAGMSIGAIAEIIGLSVGKIKKLHEIEVN